MKKLIIIFSVFVFCLSANAATYTVKTSGGNYTSPGTCANAASPGDVCEVYNGSYSGWTQSANGSAGGGYIIVRAASGQTPSLTSSVSLGGRSYVHIEGFTISGSVSCSSYGSYLKVINNSVTGMMTFIADYVLISGNTFNNMANDAIRQFGRYFIVRGNSMVNESDTNDEHMDMWQSWCESGRTVAASHLVFENNTYVNISGSNVHFTLTNSTNDCTTGYPTKLIYRFNKVHNIGSRATWIDANNAHASTANNHIYNNTFSYLGNGNETSSPSASSMTASNYSSAKNNIVVNSLERVGATGWAVPPTGWVQRNNLYYSSNGTISFSGAAVSEVGAVKNQNPLLVNPGALDFSVSSGSPAIDAGGALTTVATGDSGSGTTLLVADASYFSWGWGIAEGDWIAVRTVARPDMLIDFEQGTIGATLTAANLNAATRGAYGSWGTPSSRFTVSSDNRKTDYPTYWSGAWYNDSTGTRSVSFNDNTTAEGYAIYTFSTTYNNISAGMFFKFGNFDTDYTFHDIFKFRNDSINKSVVPQIWAYQATEEYSLECFDGSTRRAYDSSDRTMPDLQNNHWYWMAVQKYGTTAKVTVYDPANNWAPVTPIPTITGITDFAVQKIYLGNDMHNEASATSHQYDNLIVSLTGQWPILPTGAVQYAQITGIDYATNTITLSSGITRNVGDEVYLYKLTDGTVVFYGVVPDIGTYEYIPSGEDLTAPIVTISTSDPQTINSDSLSVAWTCSDAVGVTSQKWRIGAAPSELYGTVATSPATTSGYSQGSNTLYVGCGDAAGNWESDSITVTYDLVPAFIDNLSPSGVLPCTSNPCNVVLSHTTDEAATSRMTTVSSAVAYADMTDTFTTTGSTSHSETKSLACGASYNYWVRTSDAAGNVNTSSEVISFSIASPQIAGPGGLRLVGGKIGN